MTVPLRVCLCLMVAALALALLPHPDQTSLAAQNPPTPPHQYYGDGSADSAARIDGVAAPEGTVIIALDAAQNEVGRTTVSQTHWLIQISEEDAEAVSFEFLGCGGRSQAFPVESGGLTAVPLAVSGCEPTIERATLAAPEAGANEEQAGESSADPGATGGEVEQAAPESAAGADAPRETAPEGPIPAQGNGGVDAWIWILLGLPFGAGALGALVWIRRPVEPGG